MKITEKLIGYLHSTFDKSPDGFVAFRIRHTSPMFRWVVKDRFFYAYDANTLLFGIDLTQHTLLSLCGALNGYTGITVPYTASRVELNISAKCLIDGAGFQAASNGDCVSAYTSLLWAYMDAVAMELEAAEQSILDMLDQTSIKTASDDWLDEWGGYFDVTRNSGELNPDYSNRIIIEVIQPRGNNKAMEIALLRQFGQVSTVTDLVRYKDATVVYNGTYLHNGVKTISAPLNYDAASSDIFGLFTVDIAYDLESGLDMLAYADAVITFIEKFRDAGTHLESLQLIGAGLSDTLPQPTDGISILGVSSILADTLTTPTESTLISGALGDMADSLTAPSDAGSLTESYSTLFDGGKLFNGVRNYNSTGTVTSAL